MKGLFLREVEKLLESDFNMSQVEASGECLVRLTEINDMLNYGVLELNKQKLSEYHFDTRVIYDKTVYTREEAMKLWYGANKI